MKEIAVLVVISSIIAVAIEINNKTNINDIALVPTVLLTGKKKKELFIIYITINY